ncbi:MAG: SDR family NAD(P)-dependent oxidoreductase [Planctomycetota bacterium]|nr:MAG: SDR family NAD(P)-dependent oxidoreductase [Planctomycetota bacterium]
MKSLENKVAIITGASRGVGKAVALKLAREGASIVVAAKTTEPNPKLPGTIYDTAKEVEKLGSQALPIKVNLRNADEIERMVEKTLETFGKVDILINNAGALWWYPVLETPPNRFDLVMDVNVRASFLCARAVLPSMIKQKWGHIVNMSPPIDLAMLPNKVAYSISKFGMTMISHGLAEEVREHNIGVQSLWPATIVESQASINFGLGDPSHWRKPEILADATYYIVKDEPLKRTGKALIDEEVLREAGIQDFDQYNCVPGGNPIRIVGPQAAWNVEAGKTKREEK